MHYTNLLLFLSFATCFGQGLDSLIADSGKIDGSSNSEDAPSSRRELSATYTDMGKGWCESQDSDLKLCSYVIGSSYAQNPYSDSQCQNYCSQYDNCMGWSNAILAQGGCQLYFLSDAQELTDYPSYLPGFGPCGTQGGSWCEWNAREADHGNCLNQGALIGGSNGSQRSSNHRCYRKVGDAYDPTTAAATTTEAATTAAATGFTYSLVIRQTLPYLFSPNEHRLNADDPTNENYAILDELESFRDDDGKFYFRLTWPEDSITYEWSQTSNPLTEAIAGYEPISVPYTGRSWGGLEPGSTGHANDGMSLMDGSVNHSNWYYAVGAFTTWQNGIPSYAKSDSDAKYPQQSVELYVRHALIEDNGTVEGWFMGKAGENCDQTCSAVGGKCNSSKQSTLTTNDLVESAFSDAGYTCKSFHDARDYPGTPFSTGRSNDDCAPIIAGGISSCSENQGNSHSPLCFCDGQSIVKDCEQITCTPISQCHIAGTCTGGICSDPFAPIGTPCDDGDAFTINDVCDGSGSCFGVSAAPSVSPTFCPTPNLGHDGANLIDESDSSMRPNGRVYIDFTYHTQTVTDFNITMEDSSYDYSKVSPDAWNNDVSMCFTSINREFTYNQMLQAVEFHVSDGEANLLEFTIDTEVEYLKPDGFEIDGFWIDTSVLQSIGKAFPFKMSLPKTSSVTVAFTSNQEDLSSNFTIGSYAPTTALPSLTPTVLPSLSPSVKPTDTPTTSRPSLTPSLSPSYMPTTVIPSVSPTTNPSKNPSVQPSAQPSMKPSVCPSVSPSKTPSVDPSTQPSVAPTSSPTTPSPTMNPSLDPTSSFPSTSPSWSPSLSPSSARPSTQPSSIPSISPSYQPSLSPSTQPSTSPSSAPSVIPTALPTYSFPSSCPTLTPSAQHPSQSPSSLPSTSPSVAPTTSMPTTLEPSSSPLPASKIRSTILPKISTETQRPGENPLVEIQYWTVIKKPWFLMHPVATGNAIVGDYNFETLRQDDCNQFSILKGPEEFVEQFFCQEWNLQFEGDRRCNADLREVNITYSASEPNQVHTTAVAHSWELNLGSSPAFECAKDIGAFQIALAIEGASGGNKNFDTPGEAFLDDWYYLRVAPSSGSPVTAVFIENLDIQSATGAYLCQNCETVSELQIGISDWNPDNFVVHMILDSSMFAGHLTATLSFTFGVEMSVTGNSDRRRLQELETQVKSKLTLRLSPNSGQTPQTRPPTQASPYSRIPTNKPVDEPMIPEITTNLSATSAESGPQWTYVLIGIAACGFILLGAYCYFKTGKPITNDWKLEGSGANTKLEGNGSLYSIQVQLQKAGSPEPISPTARSPVE